MPVHDISKSGESRISENELHRELDDPAAVGTGSTIAADIAEVMVPLNTLAAFVIGVLTTNQ